MTHCATVVRENIKMDVIPKLKRESSFESSTSATSDSTEDEVRTILRNLVGRSVEVLRHLFFCRNVVFQKLESLQRVIFKTDKRPWPDISSSDSNFVYRLSLFHWS